MTTDPNAAVEVWARMLCAADVHMHGEDHPTWQQLVGEPGSRIRDDYRKAAAWLLPRMTVPAVAPATDQAALRERIITALNNAHHTHPCPALGDEIWSGCVHYDEAGRVAGVGSCHSGRRADAVLSVLPASADRAAMLRDFLWRLEQPAGDAATEKFLDDNPELRRMAAESVPAVAGHADNETQGEDPARIDRLRPEFFEHASVESIDSQIRRAQTQQRQWGNRVQTLTILRQARVMQKELGEWPAGGAQQATCKCPAEICQCGHQQQPKETRP